MPLHKFVDLRGDQWVRTIDSISVCTEVAVANLGGGDSDRDDR